MTAAGFIARALSAPDRPLGDQGLDIQYKTQAALQWMGLEPGMVVMDLMAGYGYLVEVLSRVIGEHGKVYAVQPGTWMDLKLLRESWQARCKRYQHPNLIPIDGGDMTRLDGVPSASVDMVISYLSYHDTTWMGTDRDLMNREILRVLKPSGAYIICDNTARDGHGNAEFIELHRIDKALVERELADAGFMLHAESDLLAVPDDTRDWKATPTGGRGNDCIDRFMLRFVKADGPWAAVPVRRPAAAARAERAPESTDELLRHAESHGVTLSKTTLERIAQGQPGYTLARAARFVRFQERVNRDILQHRILRRNPYREWFQCGEMTTDQLRSFVIQFSVFSRFFLLALLKKTIEAPTVAQMRATKEILMNELGVSYRPTGSAEDQSAGHACTGTIEGGVFRHETAHYQWMIELGASLGLRYENLGRSHLGAPATVHFGSELLRLYGSNDEQVAIAANYAVEQFGFADFWTPLIQGVEKYNQRHGASVPLDYFRHHYELESQHVGHVQDELEEHYFSTEVDEERFLAAGTEMLDAFAVFWEGLDEMRRHFG